MNSQSFSKIWIIIVFVVFLAGGIFAWQSRQPAQEELKITETEKPKVEIQEGKVEKALSICAKIKDVEKRNVCTGIVNGDPETCEALTESEKTSCYISLGRRIDDSSICERLGNEGLKYDCLARLTGDYEKCKKSVLESYCYYDVAMIQSDSSVCKNISDEPLRNKCFALLTKNQDYCQRISGQSTSESVMKDFCYFQVAMLTNDSSICEKLQREKDNCVNMVEKNIENLECSPLIATCGFFAGFTGDDSACQKMVNSDYCYRDAAMGLIGIYPLELPQGW